jgi:transcriptional regulator with XRE-family HTH domain
VTPSRPEDRTEPKYKRAADRVRAQVADGILLPGQPAPSGAELARATGYSDLTCRRALRTLVEDGVLVAGHTPNARPRVFSPALTPGEKNAAASARALSTALGTLRRRAGLTQRQLGRVAGVSLTAVGHAETGRLWHSRDFWEHADKALNANRELLALHDAYAATLIVGSAATAAEDPGTETGDAGTVAGIPPAVAVAASGPVACVTITWADGAVTTVYPPGSQP